MSETVQACPDCGTTTIVVRGGGINQYGVEGERWLCRDCGVTFEEPVRRERRTGTGGTDAGLSISDTLAATLDQMDPDEFEEAL